MGVKRTILESGRNSIIAVIGIAAGLVATYVSSLTNFDWLTTIVGLIGIAIFAIVIYSHLFADSIEVTLIKRYDEFSEATAKEQHFAEYNVVQDIAHFKGFVQIPGWYEHFRVRIKTTDGVRISCYNYSDYVDYKNESQVFTCRDDVPGFHFEMKVKSKDESAGMNHGNNQLTFINDDTGQQLSTISVKKD